MNTRSLLLLLLLAGSISTAYAQITITEADVRNSIGARFTTTNYTATNLAGLQAIADMTGSNRTFDFRTATFDAGESFTVELISCSADLPGCSDPDFAAATIIGREVYPGATADSVALSFVQLSASGVALLGAAFRADFDPTNPGPEEGTLKYNPPLLAQKLPLTMGTNWTMTTMLESSLLPFSPLFDESYAVDAWGSLVTPAGSSPALKLWNRTIEEFSFAGITLIDTSYTVSFITKTDLSASITLDAGGTVTGASYSKTADPGSATEDDTEVPARIALEQNFPNPFNPSTTIPFTLRQTGPVELRIFDLLGREVAVLVDETRPAGTYEAVWQPGDLPSGVYLYRLSEGGTSLVRPLTLIK